MTRSGTVDIATITPGRLEWFYDHLSAESRAEWAAQQAEESKDVFVQDVMAAGPGAVVEYCQVPVMVVGAYENWPGNWQSWAFTTRQFGKGILCATRYIMQTLLPYARSKGMHRGEACSLATNTRAHRWFECMGAVRESVLRKYGKNGEDFVTYVWS